MTSLDLPKLVLLDAIEKASHSLTMNPHFWNRKDQQSIRLGIDHMMKAVGKLENIELNPCEPSDTWKTLNG